MTRRRFPLSFALTTYLIVATCLILAVAWLQGVTA